MRISVALPLLTGLLVAGCAHKQGDVFKPVAGATPGLPPNGAAATRTAKPPPGKLEVTPVSSLVGKVARYNEAGRFVVLEFSTGRMPALEQRLSVYRNGLKVGELKVTGPQRDDHIVADVANGEAQTGDQVRDK